MAVFKFTKELFQRLLCGKTDGIIRDPNDQDKAIRKMFNDYFGTESFSSFSRWFGSVSSRFSSGNHGFIIFNAIRFSMGEELNSTIKIELLADNISLAVLEYPVCLDGSVTLEFPSGEGFVKIAID